MGQWERQRIVALNSVGQSQRGGLFSCVTYDKELFTVSLLCLSLAYSPFFFCELLRESSEPECGDATSFSSHYVLIRGRHRGGGE